MYLVRDGRICRQKQTRDGFVLVPLCNFVARVTEEVVFDDGVKTTRAWRIEGALTTREKLPPICVPLSRFPSMAWVPQQWGVRAVVHAGYTTRDYLREAIQLLSTNAPHRLVFTHTGWREVDGDWVYLTANGAVGVASIDVDLGPDLGRYRLPLEAQAAVAAMQASLRLLEVGPLTVTVPLWAAVFRAPLASAHPVDLSLWLEGMTGSLKSTLAALFLSHFGEFDRLHLPGSWSSTANQLEHRAFVLKDTLFVIDDYAPRAGLDDRDLQAKATRILRAQGNLSGRGRLNPDSSEAPGAPPRGLILATGEQHPPGQSMLARMFLIELKRSETNMGILSAAQKAAHLLPHAMAGYLDWLVPQMSELPQRLGERFQYLRDCASSAPTAHLRLPEAVAHLYLGLETGLDYAVTIGACSERQRDDLAARGWEALLEGGSSQGQLVEGERPTLRFVRLLATLVIQGRVLIVMRGAEAKPLKPGADFLGWYDEHRLYLLPEATFTAVTRFARDSGTPFPIQEERVRREFVEEGLSEHDPGRLLKTVRIPGMGTLKLLCLLRENVSKAMEEPFPVVPSVTGYGE
jgi:hypothetical protein